VAIRLAELPLEASPCHVTERGNCALAANLYLRLPAQQQFPVRRHRPHLVRSQAGGSDPDDDTDPRMDKQAGACVPAGVMEIPPGHGTSNYRSNETSNCGPGKRQRGNGAPRVASGTFGKARADPC
jgi:hypothetical protein